MIQSSSSDLKFSVGNSDEASRHPNNVRLGYMNWLKCFDATSGILLEYEEFSGASVNSHKNAFLSDDALIYPY